MGLFEIPSYGEVAVAKIYILPKTFFEREGQEILYSYG